ncbi:MAG TPA: SCO family protein [Stellaceae bacterium]|jgi:protein SCO1/2
METNSPGAPGTEPRAKASPRFLVAAALLVGLMILGAGGFLALELHNASRGAQGTLLGSAIGGPFQLVDQNGRIVTNTQLEGKWLLVYFGYTHCPDACPTALNNIAVALHDLGAKQRGEVRPVFITIDPARDTSAVMKDYVTAFDAPILALTGTAKQVAKAADDYRVYYAKQPEPGGDYSMDHSSIIYVMDPKGRFSASFSGADSPQEMAARLKQLLA